MSSLEPLDCIVASGLNIRAILNDMHHDDVIRAVVAWLISCAYMHIYVLVQVGIKSYGPAACGNCDRHNSMNHQWMMRQHMSILLKILCGQFSALVNHSQDSWSDILLLMMHIGTLQLRSKVTRVTRQVVIVTHSRSLIYIYRKQHNLYDSLWYAIKVLGMRSSEGCMS